MLTLLYATLLAVHAGDPLQGRHEVLSWMMAGRDERASLPEKFEYEFDGDTMILRLGPALPEAFAYKLDATAKPCRIELVQKLGRDAGKSVKGICKIDGPTITICLPLNCRHERPKEFNSTPENKNILFVLKRKTA